MSDDTPPGLLAAERRQALLTALATDNRIDVAQAAKKLGTSHETIRKDLIALSDQGLLRRVHGGALPLYSVTHEERIEQRTHYLEEKSRIAQEALSELPPEGAILLDSGSTTSILAELLPDSPAVTVFTNSLPVANTLFSKPRIPCYLVGGRTRDFSHATVGPWALGALAELRVDVAFVGTNAVSYTRGLSTPDADEAAVKASMLAHAERRVLLADHSKFNQDAMFAYATFSDIDLIITGAELAPAQRDQLEACIQTVVYA